MENLVNIKINGFDYQVPAGSTILEAAHSAGIEIPTLCYLKDINAIGACRICVVEVKGARSLVTACVYPINEGMEVWTNTAKVRESRKTTLELLLSNHKKECLSCVRSGNCELQQMCKAYGVTEENKYAGDMLKCEIDSSAAHMIRDNSKCVLCRRCVAVCEKVQGIGVIGANGRGFSTYIGSAFDMDLADTSCVSCGQCMVNCPFAAIADKVPEELLENLKIQATELTDELIDSHGLYNKTAIAMAELFIQGISAFVAIVLGVIISIMFSAVLGFIAHLPIIGFANRILGLAAGAVNGLLVVWIVFYLVAVLCATEVGSTIITQIYENEMLLYLYENNIVLTLLT